MKIKAKILIGVAMVSALLFGISMNNFVSAEEQNAGSASENVGLTVTPSIDKMGILEPGETYEREISIVNSSKEEATFKIFTSSFWVENEDYEVKWGTSESQHGKISGWTNIDPNKTHTVKAGETYDFKYNITVPRDQAGGSQHLMVTIGMEAAGGNGFVTTETHLNTLIYADINGETNPGAEIVSHNIQGFSFTPSVSTTSVVKNTGNVDIDVKYRLSASGLFSKEETLLVEDEKTLMTDSSRMLEQRWENAPLLGIYNVTQEIDIMGEVHVFTSAVIICPLWLIILLVLTIVVMAVYLVYKNSKRKKNSKR